MNNIVAINQHRSEMAKARFNSLPSKRFGSVEVIGFAEPSRSGVKRVMVKCDCGNEYPMTAIYLRKIGETRCQRCSQILRHYGKEGYQQFLDKGKYWVNKKTPDNQYRSLRE